MITHYIVLCTDLVLAEHQNIVVKMHIYLDFVV
jgi:hypothetical protein